MTPLIRIAQVFPKLVGKKTHATFEGLLGDVKVYDYYALCSVHYDAYFHKNDGAKK